MVLRIAAAARVIRNTFRGHEDAEAESSPAPLSGLVPDTDMTLLLLSAAATCLLSEIYIYPWSALAHLALGAIMALVVVVAIVVKEEYILVFFAQKFRSLTGRGNVEEE